MCKLTERPRGRVAHERGNELKRAVDDYTTALELFADKNCIASAGYLGLARAHDKLGQFCDAALAIEQWVAIGPRNDTAQARTLIRDYAAKGKCAATGKMEGLLGMSFLSRFNVVVGKDTIKLSSRSGR